MILSFISSTVSWLLLTVASLTLTTPTDPFGIVVNTTLLFCENSIVFGEYLKVGKYKKIANYKACDIRFNGDNKILEYIESNRTLLLNRPQSFQHGDYHVGNMVIDKEVKLGIIDFNRLDYGDQWEEFNRITLCAQISPQFASGYINGYFDNAVPDSFFRLMALYIAINQLSSIPWVIPFGQDEVNTILEQTKGVLEWYDDFKKYIPDWYSMNN